jgi:hypothetical protein
LPIPPSKVTSFEKPPAYYTWLKDLKEDVIIAEYPPRFDIADALVWQTYHHKKILNSFSNEVIQIWANLTNLSDPMTADLLASLGVKYVVFHTKYLYNNVHPFDELYYTRYAEPPTYDKIKKIDVKEFGWLKLVQNYPDARVYELASTNSKFVSFTRDGNSPPQFLSGIDLKLKNGENFIYLMNFGNKNRKVVFDFDGELTTAGNIELNAVSVSSIKGAIFNLREGLNYLKIKLDTQDGLPNIKLKIKNLARAI